MRVPPIHNSLRSSRPTDEIMGLLLKGQQSVLILKIDLFFQTEEKRAKVIINSCVSFPTESL